MAGIDHILAGFSLGLRYRHRLKEILNRTGKDCSVLNISPESLRQQGISALALDFDGVLAHHGAPYPLPETCEWLKRCETVFGADSIFILSNRPTTERITWFSSKYPGIRFISGVRKKPYPDGLIKTGELAGVPLSCVMMIDDRLLTGCLAALIAGARPMYIRKPCISFGCRPFAELFYILLRAAERLMMRLAT